MNSFLRRSLCSVFIFCSAIISTKAQLCTGSLGDPIVKFTFGYDTLQLGIPPNPLAPGITNYTYIANSCPLDGSYTVSNQTQGCFGNTWYDVLYDHTANDSLGYMMLVNATNVPGDFYTQTVRGLCGSTTYEFAAWLLNLNVPTACGGNPTKPNITFRIETVSGSVLKTYNSGDISPSSTPVWKQYGTFFTTPANTTDVVIRMINNAPGGCGNDIALDDITFRACGASVSASINGSLTTKNVCASNVSSNTFSGNIPNPSPTTAYQWQISNDNGVTWQDIAGATAATYIPTVTTQGTYIYRLTVADAPGTPSTCRTLSNLLTFIIDASPIVPAFTALDTVCLSNTPVVFTDIPQNPAGAVAEWIWDFGDNSPSVHAGSNVSQPHIYTAASTYTVSLQVKNAAGCTSPLFTKPIVVSSAPSADFSFSNNCTNIPIQFTASNTGSTSQYTWDFGDNTSSTQANPLKSFSTGGTFNVTLTVKSAGCTATISHPVQILSVLGSPVVTLDSAGANFLNFSWLSIPGAVAYKVSVDNGITFTDPSSGSTGTTHTITNLLPAQSVTLLVKAIGTTDCENSSANASGTTKATVSNTDIYIPNAFTPNNDGKNDAFKVYGNNIKLINMKVFNQWGQLIFATSDKDLGWNGISKGEFQPVGVYIYVVEITTADNKVIVKKGSINLVR